MPPQKKKRPVSHELLAKKALYAHTLAQEAKAANDAAKAAKDEVLAEMVRTGTKAIEQHVGEDLVRISLAEPESTIIHEDKILAAIKRRKDDALLQEITYTETFVDQAKLLSAVQAGKIPMRVLERNSEVVPKTKYITITVKSDN
jgi:sRNA-binding carbon storage regulator CsrA